MALVTDDSIAGCFDGTVVVTDVATVAHHLAVVAIAMLPATDVVRVGRTVTATRTMNSTLVI